MSHKTTYKRKILRHTPCPTTLREWLENMLAKHPELSLKEICRELDVTRSTISVWRYSTAMPIHRAMKLAEFLGEDARKVRAIGLRDRHPELFQGRYDDLLDTLNDHDRACLKILREVPMENPKMQEALKFLLEGFVEAYKRQKEEASPTQPAE